MSKRIGITGNIGAGKTTACREFERLGIPVYYADERAKLLMVEDDSLRRGIVAAFGEQAYTPTGLNRDFLGRSVFGDPERLAVLNGLVHPAVARDAERWQQRQTAAPYTLHEAAIILEIGAQAQYDKLIVVDCPLAVRQRRVMTRDGASAEAFLARAERQWSDERKRAAADYLIVNDGRSLLLPQVLRIDRLLRT